MQYDEIWQFVCRTFCRTSLAYVMFNISRIKNLFESTLITYITPFRCPRNISNYTLSCVIPSHSLANAIPFKFICAVFRSFISNSDLISYTFCWDSNFNALDTNLRTPILWREIYLPKNHMVFKIQKLICCT